MTARRDGRTSMERHDVVDIVYEVLTEVLSSTMSAELSNRIVADLEVEGVHVDGWVPG